MSNGARKREVRMAVKFHDDESSPNGLDDDATGTLFNAFLAERSALQGEGLSGWVVYGFERGQVVRVGQPLAEYDEADRLGRKTFGGDQYIVQSLDGEDAPDYTAVIPID